MHSSDESETVSSTPSRSPTPTPTLSRGGRKRTPVWRFFDYEDSTNKCTCKVETVSGVCSEEPGPSGRLCGHVLTGKYPINMKLHLKKFHPAEYDDMLQREATLKEAKQTKVSTTGPVKKKQLTLEQAAAMVTHYDRSSHRYQLITRKLAIFVGCTNVANSLVENEEFQSLIQKLDPRYKVPGRATVGKEIDKVMFDVKDCIQKVLADARKVSLCTDIWTKKGLTLSYLGLTAHFF